MKNSLVQGSDIAFTVPPLRPIPQLWNNYKQARRDMQQRLTDRSRAVLHLAVARAQQSGYRSVRPSHLLAAIANENDNAASHVLVSHHLTAEAIQRSLLELASAQPSSRPVPVRHVDFAPDARRIIQRARKHAAAFDSLHIDPEHILLAVLDAEDPEIERIVENCSGVPLQVIADDLIELLLDTLLPDEQDFNPQNPNTRGLEDGHPLEHPLTHEGDDGATLDRTDRRREPIAFSPPVTLAGAHSEHAREPDYPEYLTDLTHLASSHLSPLFGREQDVQRLVQILLRRHKGNPLLVGPAGVGKTAIVEGFASLIAAQQVPEELLSMRVLAVDMGLMMAGTRHRGDMEQRVKEVLSLVSRNRDLVLFIDEIHVLMGAGAGGGSLGVAELLKPALARGDIRVIGATTPEEQRAIVKDEALARRFSVLPVEEMTADRTRALLYGVRDSFEKHHRVSIDDAALDAVVSLSGRHFTNRSFPDKAIDVLDEAGAMAGMRGLPVVDARVISDTVSAMTGVPILAEITGDSSMNARGVRERFEQHLVGQPQAVDVLSRAVLRSHAGLTHQSRPRGVFLFIGSPGVGKTEAARLLAKEIAPAGVHESLITVDLSEFGDAHSISRLLGAPPGFVGFEDGGELTEAVRRKPYSVVLLDEADKAHPHVLNTFLQVFESGILTDGQGRVTDFRHCFVIMTANSGASASTSGFLQQERTPPTSGAGLVNTVSWLRPELVNRFDHVVFFHNLDNDGLTCIARQHLSEVERMLHAKGLTLTVAPDVAAWLAAASRPGDVGARGVRTAVRVHVLDAIADALFLPEADNADGFHLAVSGDGDSLQVTFTR